MGLTLFFGALTSQAVPRCTDLAARLNLRPVTHPKKDNSFEKPA
jgi:hypothetical protein